MKYEFIVILLAFLLGMGFMRMVDPVQHRAAQMYWALEACINSNKHAFILHSDVDEVAMLCARVEKGSYFDLTLPFNTIFPKG